MLFCIFTAMRRALISILVFCFTSCSQFSKLSRYEKSWTFAHPFAAAKAKRLSRDIFKTYNEVKASPLLDHYENGGKLDAFRHVFAMAILSSKINSRKIKKLGIAHEKGNRRDFERGRAEDGELPDSLGTEMDLRNNELGIRIGRSFSGKKITITEIRNEVINEIQIGNAWYLKRDRSGAYLNCMNVPINMELWKGKWGIPKCIISTKE
jgi:hypothetical protein